MALVQVQNANGQTMTVDEANLAIWTSAGWKPQSSPSSAPGATTQSGPMGYASNLDKSLQAKVEAAGGSLASNAAFVNAAFKAFHGRDANAQELQKFVGKPVSQVRADVKAGAPQWLQSQTQAKLASSSTGPDMTGWSDSMKEAYGVLKEYVDGLRAQGKTVNPSAVIDEATTARFLAQAKSELGPYYQQLLGQAQLDVRRGLARVSEDYATQAERIGQSYGRNLEATQNDLAKRGLTFSSARDRAEGDLATATNQSLFDLQRGALRSGEDIGTAGERFLGSANLPSGLPSITSGYSAQTGGPGILGLNSGGSRSLYSPITGLTGEAQRDQTTSELLRQQELLSQERLTRGVLTM